MDTITRRKVAILWFYQEIKSTSLYPSLTATFQIPSVELEALKLRVFSLEIPTGDQSDLAICPAQAT